MAWYTYAITPIDFNWEFLRSVKETAEALIELPAECDGDIDMYSIQEFLSDWELAKTAAKTAGWEGDFRHEPSVFWIPDEESFSYGFVFKQENNGNTFVISPVPMPWLSHIVV